MNYFLLGFLAKLVTGFDDTAVHIPLQSAVTRSKRGKIAFSLGLFCAVCVAVVIALVFAPMLKRVPHFKTLSGVVLIVLSVLIYLDVFVHEKRKKMEQKVKQVSFRRLMEVFGVGFAASFATVIDDVLVFTPLFALEGNGLVLSGILTAALLEVLFISWGADYAQKIPHKDDIASLGLLVFGLGMLLGYI